MAWIVGIALFLFLLFAFPKPMGILLLLLGGVAAIFYLSSEAENRRRAEERASVRMSAKHDTTICGDQKFPILVSVRNGAKKTIKKASFTLEGRLPNHSEPIASKYLSSDRILVPGELYGSCWNPHKTYGPPIDDVSSLLWTVDVGYIEFQ